MFQKKQQKFQKTNQGTCINLKPIVQKGDKVLKGQVLCQGYATQNGELALGSWQGVYLFEHRKAQKNREVVAKLQSDI